MKMKTTWTLATLTVVALLAIAAVGCGKKAGPPPGAPQITTPPPGPGPAQAGPAATKPEAEKPAEKPEAGPQQKPAEKAKPEGTSGDKPAKAKLSDDQFVELMGDLAVAIKKIGDAKMSAAEAEAELEKVAKKYGLTLDELRAEQEAHDVGTPEERAALGQKVFEKIQQRLQEAEKKSGQ